MALLSAAVALVGVLCLLDLVLTLGVIRRLREHNAHLVTLLSGGTLRPMLPEVGTVVGDFTATTTGGETISREVLVGNTVMAFFSESCDACNAALPGFLAYARDGGLQVLSVIHGQADHPGTVEMAQALGVVGRVIVEDGDGSVGRALDVDTFPLFCLVDASGAVAAAEIDPALLPAPTRA